MLWNVVTGRQDDLGYIPEFVSEDDPRPLAEQINENYAHGGGWRPFKGFEFDFETLRMAYPGDPAMDASAYAFNRSEVIVVFPYGWVLILDLATLEYEVARLD